jgi:hypothetical protein
VREEGGVTTTKRKLTEEEKAFLVSAFAAWNPLREVCRLFEERFGRPITSVNANKYDLNGWAGRENAYAGSASQKKWRPLFDQVRARFIEDASTIAITHKTFRLREIDAHYRRVATADRVNVPLAMQLLEQAAKESGGLYTNATKVKHEGEVKAKVAPEETMSDEEKRAIVEQRVAGAIDRFITTVRATEGREGRKPTAH